MKKKKSERAELEFTCQRPASRPYFLVVSSAEADGEGGFCASLVFSLTALTATRFELGLRGLGEEGKKQNRSRLRHGDEGEQQEGEDRAGSKFTASIFRPNQKDPTSKSSFSVLIIRKDENFVPVNERGSFSIDHEKR